MITYEKITVQGYIGSVYFNQNGTKPFFKLTVSPGDRTVRGEKRAIWYNVLIPLSEIHDENRFREMYVPGRRVIVDGRPRAEAYIDSTGELRAETAIIVKDQLPFLMDRPSR